MVTRLTSRGAAALSCLWWLLVAAPVFVVGQEEVTTADVSIFLIDPITGNLSGVPIAEDEALEQLESYQVFESNRIRNLLSLSEEVFISDIDDLLPSKCSIPNSAADRLISGAIVPGRRLLQCVPWFSRCAQPIPAAARTPCRIPAPPVGPEAEEEPIPIECPAEPPTPTVFVVVCVKKECFSLFIQNSMYSPAFLTSGQMMCGESFSTPVEPPSVAPPSAKPPSVDPPGVDPPGVAPPSAKPPSVDPPSVDPPNVDPPNVDPPSVKPPSVDPPNVDPPNVDPPSVKPPSVDPPSVDPPGVDPPKVDPPSVRPPSVDPPNVKPPGEEPKGKKQKQKKKKQKRLPARVCDICNSRFDGLRLCCVGGEGCRIENIKPCKNGGFMWKHKNTGRTCKCK